MAQAQNPGKMVQVNLVDRTSIYNSYMSFLNNGGVFIASDDTFAMGDEVLLVLEVGEAADRFPLKTTVCWINPVRGSTTRPRGVGLARQGLPALYYPEQQSGLNALAQHSPQLWQQLVDKMHKLMPFGQHTLNVKLQLEDLSIDYLNLMTHKEAH